MNPLSARLTLTPAQATGSAETPRGERRCADIVLTRVQFVPSDQGKRSGLGCDGPKVRDR